MPAFISVGGAWVRVDQIAVVDDYEVTLLQGVTVALNDGETADDIVARMVRRALESEQSVPQ